MGPRGGVGGTGPTPRAANCTHSPCDPPELLGLGVCPELSLASTSRCPHVTTGNGPVSPGGHSWLGTAHLAPRLLPLECGSKSPGGLTKHTPLGPTGELLAPWVGVTQGPEPAFLPSSRGLRRQPFRGTPL